VDALPAFGHVADGGEARGTRVLDAAIALLLVAVLFMMAAHMAYCDRLAYAIEGVM